MTTIRALFCKTLPLSSNAVLGLTDHLLQPAPKTWNGLPDYTRKENDFDKFKRLIKTHYFGEDYSDLS